MRRSNATNAWATYATSVGSTAGHYGLLVPAPGQLSGIISKLATFEISAGFLCAALMHGIGRLGARQTLLDANFANKDLPRVDACPPIDREAICVARLCPGNSGGPQ